MSEDPLAPERVAAHLAPIVDRLRISIARQIAARGSSLPAVRGLEQDGFRTIGMLRNLRPDRIVTRAQVDAVFQFVPPEARDKGMTDVVGAGLVDELPGDRIRLTPAGDEVVAAVYALTTEIVVELWAGHDDRIRALNHLAGRALSAAATTGGPAFAVMSPPYEPDGAPVAVVLAERLTPLRFHRFDAHLSARAAAGYTAADLRALRDGPEKDAVEAETNRIAAAPYVTLTPAERAELIAGLGALPN